MKSENTSLAARRASLTSIPATFLPVRRVRNHTIINWLPKVGFPLKHDLADLSQESIDNYFSGYQTAFGAFDRIRLLDQASPTIPPSTTVPLELHIILPSLIIGTGRSRAETAWGAAAASITGAWRSATVPGRVDIFEMSSVVFKRQEKPRASLLVNISGSWEDGARPQCHGPEAFPANLLEEILHGVTEFRIIGEDETVLRTPRRQRRGREPAATIFTTHAYVNRWINFCTTTGHGVHRTISARWSPERAHSERERMPFY